MYCLAMLSPTTLLMVGGPFLLLFGYRRLVFTASWIYHELSGNKHKAEEAEVRLGRELAKSLLRDMPLVEDSEATRLVTTIGERLAAGGEGWRESVSTSTWFSLATPTALRSRAVSCS